MLQRQLETSEGLLPLRALLIALLPAAVFLSRPSSSMEAVGGRIKISSAARDSYFRYKHDYCVGEAAVYNETEYLEWEENAFLQALRVSLLPEAKHDQLNRVSRDRLVMAEREPRLLNAHFKSFCMRNERLRAKENDVQEAALFEDTLQNLMFYSITPLDQPPLFAHL